MNKIDLEGKNAIVTGGARGIGFAIAQRLLASGARCSLWDIDEEALKSAGGGLQAAGEVHTAKVDVANAAEIRNAAEATLKHFGRIDILVNNAGIAGVSKKLWECTPEEWRQVIEIDLIGVFLCCRAVVPRM